MVLLFHFNIPTPGPLGVMIFFVLSGFLITGILLREFARYGSISLGRFYTRRAFRILPTFYACWLLVTILRFLHHQAIGGWTAVGSFFYLTDYIRATHPTEQTSIHMWISWSLAIEEQFYFLWPAALLFLLRKQINLVTAVTLSILAICVYRYVALAFFGMTVTYMYNAFDTRLDALLTGGLLAIIVEGDLLRVPRSWIVKSRWFVTAPLLFLGFVWVVEVKQIVLPIYFSMPSFSIQPLAISVLLLQVVHWGANGWEFLEHRSLKFLARLSYALYLYHPVAVEEALHFVPAHWRSIGFVASFLLAIGSYYGIEKPFLMQRERVAS